MGMYDTFVITCPTCKKEHEEQFKDGKCILGWYSVDNCRDPNLALAVRGMTVECCGKKLVVQGRVEVELRLEVKDIGDDEEDDE